MPWSYLVVTLTNKGRNIYENGKKLVKSHTKTAGYESATTKYVEFKGEENDGRCQRRDTQCLWEEELGTRECKI